MLMTLEKEKIIMGTWVRLAPLTYVRKVDSSVYELLKVTRECGDFMVILNRVDLSGCDLRGNSPEEYVVEVSSKMNRWSLTAVFFLTTPSQVARITSNYGLELDPVTIQ